MLGWVAPPLKGATSAKSLLQVRRAWQAWRTPYSASIAMLSWSELRYEHFAALDLPIIEYNGVQWIPLHLLARELHVRLERLRAAALNPRIPITLDVISLGLSRTGSQVAVARHSLLLLAQRLRCGTNNALLKFVSQAQDIASMTDMDVLVRHNLKVKAKLEKLRRQQDERKRQHDEFVKAYDEARAKGVPEARRQFAERLQLDADILNRFLRQTYQTVAAREAVATIKSRDGSFQPPKVPRGRPAQITPYVMQWLLKGLEAGQSPAELARKYDLSEATVLAIQKRQYRTAVGVASGVAFGRRG